MFLGERKLSLFALDLLEYYSDIDNHSKNIILTSRDNMSHKSSVGWYKYVGKEHFIYINIPKIKSLCSNKDLYAYLTLCAGHEFRHFLQGRVIWDKQISDYSIEEATQEQILLYISMFYDAYYYYNRQYLKYELGAFKFAIVNGMIYLKEKFPNMDVETSMLNAVKLYFKIDDINECKSIDDVIATLDNRMEENIRINDLSKTLTVYNSKVYANHGYYGLKDNLLNQELINNYNSLESGSDKDYLIFKTILSSLDKPVDSLKKYPMLKTKYLKKEI